MKGFHGITEERVRERAGKSCEESYRILGEYGAREKGHTLAAHLLREYGLSRWWAQAVTIRWENEWGLRG